jgi:hypothetical protein
MHTSSDKILWKGYDISQIQLNKTNISKAKQKRLILVSHSFGGMVMERVRSIVSQSYGQDLTDYRPYLDSARAEMESGFEVV